MQGEPGGQSSAFFAMPVAVLPCAPFTQVCMAEMDCEFVVVAVVPKICPPFWPSYANVIMCLGILPQLLPQPPPATPSNISSETPALDVLRVTELVVETETVL